MIPLLTVFALAASAHPAVTYKLVGEGSVDIIYPNLKACERARKALHRKNEVRRAELVRNHSGKRKGTRWVVEPVCLPW